MSASAVSAPGIVGSGSYDVTLVYGPKDMSLEKYVLISPTIKAKKPFFSPHSSQKQLTRAKKASRKESY